MNEQLIYGYPWKLWATPSSLTPMLPNALCMFPYWLSSKEQAHNLKEERVMRTKDECRIRRVALAHKLSLIGVPVHTEGTGIRNRKVVDEWFGHDLPCCTQQYAQQGIGSRIKAPEFYRHCKTQDHLRELWVRSSGDGRVASHFQDAERLLDAWAAKRVADGTIDVPKPEEAPLVCGACGALLPNARRLWEALWCPSCSKATNAYPDGGRAAPDVEPPMPYEFNATIITLGDIVEDAGPYDGMTVADAFAAAATALREFAAVLPKEQDDSPAGRLVQLQRDNEALKRENNGMHWALGRALAALRRCYEAASGNQHSAALTDEQQADVVVTEIEKLTARAESEHAAVDDLQQQLMATRSRGIAFSEALFRIGTAVLPLEGRPSIDDTPAVWAIAIIKRVEDLKRTTGIDAKYVMDYLKRCAGVAGVDPMVWAGTAPPSAKTVADATTRKIQCLAAANQRLTKSLQEIQQMATKGDA